MYVLNHCAILPWERAQHINSRARLQNPGLFLHGEPHPGLPSARFDIQIYPCPSVFFSGVSWGWRGWGRCLETIPQTHLLAACRHCWEISWQRSHSIHPLSGSFRPPQSSVSQQPWWLLRWQEERQCLQQSPAAYQSCRHGRGPDLWQLSGLWDLFAFLPFGFYSPCGKFPVVNSSAGTILTGPP